MIRGKGCGALVGMGLVSVAAAAGAAPIAGRIRLSLEGQLVGYESLSIDSATTSQTTGGLAAPSLGVGLGGGIGENVVLGARVGVATTSNNTDGASSSPSTTQFTIMGIPEYVFDGDSVRPFIGAGFGYGLVNTDAGAAKVSTGFGLIGATLGAHCFAADAFSIDPSVSAYYETGTVSVNDASRGASGFAVVLGVALSGWLGHGETPASAAESAETNPGMLAPTAQPAPVAAAARDTTWEDADELRAVVRLTGASRATFRIDPSEGDAVELVVIVDHDSPQLMSCNELAAKTAKKDVALGPFTAAKMGSGFEHMVALTTKTKLSNAKALAASDATVTLEGCGESWYITPDQTEDLRLFIKHARAALRENHPPAEGAAPAAEPRSESGSDEMPSKASGEPAGDAPKGAPGKPSTQ